MSHDAILAILDEHLNGWDNKEKKEALYHAINQLDLVTDEDVREFQEQVRDKFLAEMDVLKLKGDIDGGGCDSGDWRDFTLCEIQQGINVLSEAVSDLRKQVAG